MIENVKDFISQCPHLKNRTINLGYLGETPKSCSLEMTERKSVLREYADGGALKSQYFVLALREIYTKEVETNADALKLCANIEEWIADKQRKGDMPVLKGSFQAISIEVKKPFHLVKIESLDARYEAEIEVVWYEEN